MEKENPVYIIGFVLLVCAVPYLVMALFQQITDDSQIVMGSGLFTAMVLATWILWRMANRRRND